MRTVITLYIYALPVLDLLDFLLGGSLDVFAQFEISWSD
jgi:hypothetical protein